MDFPRKWKKDKRPPRGWWAPGDYLNKCHICDADFIGDKRAGHCADCAYKDEEKPMSEWSHDWFSNNIPVWTRILGQLAGEPLAALEIGCYEGRATVWLLENILTHKDSSITVVDTFQGGADHKEEGVSFDGVEERFLRNVEPWDDRVVVEVMDSVKCLSDYASVPLDFDLIYIDGSHIAADVFHDIALSWLILKPGGILILDDYGWGNGRPELQTPKPAIDAFLNVFADRIQILEKGYQVIVMKKH